MHNQLSKFKKIVENPLFEEEHKYNDEEYI